MDAINPEIFVRVTYQHDGQSPYPVLEYDRYWHPNSVYTLCESMANELVARDGRFVILGPGTQPTIPCVPCREKELKREQEK